jgi:ABC-type transporter MlaC component
MEKSLLKTAESLVIITFVGALLLGPGNAGGEIPPLEVVKMSNQQILDIYAAHETIDEDTEDEIMKIMDSVTDFDEISKQTIERFCEELSPAECEEFDRVFQRLLRISSIKKLGRYRADRFDYLGDDVEGKTAIVLTTAYYKDEEVSLDYHLELIGDKWLIVNYVADDVDAIRNYQKQFQRILRKGSFSDLIKRLEAKIAEHEEE